MPCVMPDCSDSAADGHASIGKVLSSMSKQEGDDQNSVITNMDVILDTCWAVMTEIEQLKGQPPPHLQAFRDKRNDEPVGIFLDHRFRHTAVPGDPGNKECEWAVGGH